METEQAAEPASPVPEPHLADVPADQPGQDSEMPDVHEAQPAADRTADDAEEEPTLAGSTEPASRGTEDPAVEQNGHETAGKAEASSEDARYLLSVQLPSEHEAICAALLRLVQVSDFCVALCHL